MILKWNSISLFPLQEYFGKKVRQCIPLPEKEDIEKNQYFRIWNVCEDTNIGDGVERSMEKTLANIAVKGFRMAI